MKIKTYIDKIITGITLVGFAMNIMCPAAMAASYTDVPTDHWAVSVINEAANAGIYSSFECADSDTIYTGA